MARINPGYDKLCVTSRLDTFIAGDDFKFLEYNAETPAGVGDQMQLEKVLEQYSRNQRISRRKRKLATETASKIARISFYDLPRIRRKKEQTEHCHC